MSKEQKQQKTSPSPPHGEWKTSRDFGMGIDVNVSSEEGQDDNMKVTTVINNNNSAVSTNNIPNTPVAKSGCCSMNILINKNHQTTPQEFYFESRGKSCKKLLKFNGSSNKVNLFRIGIQNKGWMDVLCYAMHVCLYVCVFMFVYQ